MLFSSGVAAGMQTRAMLTDGARPWESVGGYSPLLQLKAFVWPLSPQPAMQGSCLAPAVPAATCLPFPSTSPCEHRAFGSGWVAEDLPSPARCQHPLCLRRLVGLVPQEAGPATLPLPAASQTPALPPRDPTVPLQEGAASVERQEGGGLHPTR